MRDYDNEEKLQSDWCRSVQNGRITQRIVSHQILSPRGSGSARLARNSHKRYELRVPIGHTFFDHTQLCHVLLHNSHIPSPKSPCGERSGDIGMVL